MRRRTLLSALAAASVAASPMPSWAQNATFDHSYADWDKLLKAYVHWLPDGKQSRVDYQGFASQRAELQRILAQWSALSASVFAAFSREQQIAFLVNAYNGFTIELILTKYPQLKSIKELGSFLSSAWKIKFFTLLGESHNLDWIEHEQLRPKYQDPRLHTAVNCASIGCPALRPEAFNAKTLDTQLEDGMQRFLGDRSRNRYNPQTGDLEVSSIFKWFWEDFEKGNKGFSQLEDVFAHYADQLTEDAAGRAKLRAKTASIRFLDYDWSLNAKGK